jgi:hypothetical protein
MYIAQQSRSQLPIQVIRRSSKRGDDRPDNAAISRESEKVD